MFAQASAIGIFIHLNKHVHASKATTFDKNLASIPTNNLHSEFDLDRIF